MAAFIAIISTIVIFLAICFINDYLIQRHLGKELVHCTITNHIDPLVQRLKELGATDIEVENIYYKSDIVETKVLRFKANSKNYEFKADYSELLNPNAPLSLLHHLLCKAVRELESEKDAKDKE